MHSKLDIEFVCGATLLAVVIQCTFIWWLWHTVRFRADPGALHLGDWLESLLPRAWPIAVTATMIHRLVLAVYERENTHLHRRHLRSVVDSFLALASVKDCMLWIPLPPVIR